MGDISNFTKEQLDYAISLYPESSIEKFILKYFIKNPKPENKWLKTTFVSIMILLFIWGFISTVLNLNAKFILAPTLVYASILLIFGIIGLIAIIKHSIRRYRIRKYLRLSLKDFIKLYKKFYPEENV